MTCGLQPRMNERPIPFAKDFSWAAAQAEKRISSSLEDSSSCFTKVGKSVQYYLILQR